MNSAEGFALQCYSFCTGKTIILYRKKNDQSLSFSPSAERPSDAGDNGVGSCVSAEVLL